MVMYVTENNNINIVVVVAKRKLGTQKRAKRKREEMSNVLRKMR